MAWLETHPPGIETWKSILFRRGFGPIDDSSWREKAFAEMPDVGRDRNAALLSEDRTTFALRTEGDWIFYGLARNGGGGQNVKRALWEKLGSGWEAVDRFERTALPVFRRPEDHPRISAEWRDPRSLDY
jgi:hypothetical protein